MAQNNETAESKTKSYPTKRSGGDLDDSELSKNLNDFLRDYTPSSTQDEKDILQERFHIDLNSPLPEYDSPNANAYVANDPLLPTKKFIALVCKPGTMQRMPLMPLMQASPHQYILPLLAYGVISLSPCRRTACYCL